MQILLNSFHLNDQTDTVLFFFSENETSMHNIMKTILHESTATQTQNSMLDQNWLITYTLTKPAHPTSILVHRL